MLDFVIKYGQNFSLFFLFPLFGLLLDKLFRIKQRWGITSVLTILLTPLIFGYFYNHSYINEFLGICFLGSLYSVFLFKVPILKYKLVISIPFSIVHFVVLAFAAFIDGYSGSQTIKEKWEFESNNISLIRDQGFAGRPLMKYELHEYAMGKVLIKKIDTSVSPDSEDICFIPFVKENMVFDRCEGTLEVE